MKFTFINYAVEIFLLIVLIVAINGILLAIYGVEYTKAIKSAVIPISFFGGVFFEYLKGKLHIEEKN